MVHFSYYMICDEQVKTTLSFLIPSSFTSEVTAAATKTNGESVPMSSLYEAEYVFVRSDSEPMVEGPYRSEVLKAKEFMLSMR